MLRRLAAWLGFELATPKCRRVERRARLAVELLERRDVPSSCGCGGAGAPLVGPILDPGHQAARAASRRHDEARILNGTATSDYPSVGIVGDRFGGFCTGTLIAPRFVLTAAHCSTGLRNREGRFTIDGQVFRTSRIFIHPHYRPRFFGTNRANDIAIWRLRGEVVGVEPSPIYREVPQVGQTLILVGFGAGGTGSGAKNDFGNKRVGTTPIDRVSRTLIHWNFDNNGESNTGPGDSGGPAFLDVGGILYVAGITSGGDKANAGIGDHSYDTRVDVYAGWIDKIAGTSPPIAAPVQGAA